MTQLHSLKEHKMKAQERKCFEALVKIGAPVFLRSDLPDTFGVSGEGYFGSCPVPKDKQDEDRIWVDYYNAAHINGDGSCPGVCKEICDIVDEHGLYLEWENPACLFAYPA